MHRSSALDLCCSGIEVSVHLNTTVVLRGLDLHVPAGSVTALLGASGCGKSTLVNVLLGLCEPDEGSAKIGDQDVWAATPGQLLEIHRGLSALHGGPTVYEGSVFSSLSVRDNLLARLYEKHANPSLESGSPARPTMDSNPYVMLWRYVASREAPPELVRQAEEWLDRFGLAEHADKLPQEISGGQRRRMALAAALAVDAHLYILDDFDGAIDAANRDVVVDAVRSTHDRTGATMLITTHDPALACALADRVAVLAEGRIVFDGAPRAAMSGLSRWYRQIDGPLESLAAIPAARRPMESDEDGGMAADVVRRGPGDFSTARFGDSVARVVLTVVITVLALYLALMILTVRWA